jgi:DNA-binding transcriptional MocR family regulator
MSTEKKVLLINPAAVPTMPGLAEALRAAGAEVREMNTDDYGVLLDALEQDWMPVVLKAPLD